MLEVRAAARELEHFHIVNPALPDMEAQCSPESLPAHKAHRSGVKGQHLIPLVIYYFQYMRMSADEEGRAITLDERTRADIVMPRIPPDMCHQHIHPAAFEILMSGVFRADILPVAVPVNGHQRLEIGERLREGRTAAEIPGVPELLHRFQKSAELISEDPVGIGNQTYVHNVKAAAED